MYKWVRLKWQEEEEESGIVNPLCLSVFTPIVGGFDDCCGVVVNKKNEKNTRGWFEKGNNIKPYKVPYGMIKYNFNIRTDNKESNLNWMNGN